MPGTPHEPKIDMKTMKWTESYSRTRLSELKESFAGIQSQLHELYLATRGLVDNGADCTFTEAYQLQSDIERVKAHPTLVVSAPSSDAP